MAKYQELGKGVVKRSERRSVGLFIDGTGLDRATRRINRKVDMSALVRGVTSGAVPVVARYYTLIPYEDDSRQRAFLDAVSRAHLKVIVKRLPPKGITRQVAVDVEMAADIVAFALGHTSFSDLSEYKPDTLAQGRSSSILTIPNALIPDGEPQVPAAAANGSAPVREKRSIVVVCPGRDMSYAISLVNELNIETTTADFGQLHSSDILKSAAKWIDLSDSETIWRDA